MKVDEHLGAGTTLRFVLLLVLFTASSSSMMSDHIIFSRFLGDPNNNVLGCMLASGVDPEGEFRVNIETTVGRNAQAFETCAADYSPAWWTPVLVIVLLIAAAGALYWWLPVWKGRRSRVVPLEEVDRQGDLRSLLMELVSVAGLSRAPRFVIDPARATTSAVVFGRPRRHTVCLQGGLVARRSVDPEGFRGVVLHELAHIRNGDVGITYATVALWRVFLVAVLLPYVAHGVELLFSGLFLRTDSISWVYWPGMVPAVTRGVLLSIFTVVLVYLSRADILRTRETYADLAAVGWGAAPGGWHHGAQGEASRSRIGSVLGSFAELWRTHPRWEQRRHFLIDPSALFGLQALPMFLTGTAAALVAGQLQVFPGIHSLGIRWVQAGAAWLAAGLITGVVGVALWRAVAHAVLTSRRVPSGLRAGLWLGCGLVAGELGLYQTGGNQWLPSHPVVLLVLILLAVVATCWTAQYAELWIKTLRGRTTRPAVVLVLAGTWVVFAVWLTWWSTSGYWFVNSWSTFSTIVGQWVERTYPGSAVIHYDGLSMIIKTYSVTVTMDDPLIVWAAAALWLLPLLAWTMPSNTESPRSVHTTLPDVHHPSSPEEEPPSLRRVLLAAALGGASSWVAVAAVMAYMHSWPVPFDQRDDLFKLIYWAWLLVALTAGPVATAVIMGAVATSYRLLVALVAAGVAALIGLAGMFLLPAFDGCFGPLNTIEFSCHWRPNTAWLITESLLQGLLRTGVFAAAVAALVTMGVANLVRRLTRQSVQPPTRAGRLANQRDSLTIRRICVAVICVVALGLAVTTQVNAQPASSGQSNLVEHLVFNPAVTPPSPKVRKAQLLAWYKYGGYSLSMDFAQIEESFSNGLGVLGQVPDPDTAIKDGTANVAPLRSGCVGIEQWTKKADAYFLIPDPQEQLVWSKILAQMKKGSVDCQSALTQRNTTLLETSLNDMTAAAQGVPSVLAWFEAQT